MAALDSIRQALSRWRLTWWNVLSILLILGFVSWRVHSWPYSDDPTSADNVAALEEEAEALRTELEALSDEGDLEPRSTESIGREFRRFVAQASSSLDKANGLLHLVKYELEKEDGGLMHMWFSQAVAELRSARHQVNIVRRTLNRMREPHEP